MPCPRKCFKSIITSLFAKPPKRGNAAPSYKNVKLQILMLIREGFSGRLTDNLDQRDVPLARNQAKPGFEAAAPVECDHAHLLADQPSTLFVICYLCAHLSNQVASESGVVSKLSHRLA